MIEAEICRAAQAKANIQICTTAINAVEDSLSPTLIGGIKLFVDSLRVFLRASIAQFLQVGPGATSPKLPVVPPRTLLTVAKTHEDSFPSLGPKNCAISPAQQEPS
ncbi:putative eka-like protein [Erysiphe necator]|uniref:Putative eka-like protein n=1 Tax=Uncinula necator TaxID=52586 RepID=A0A0B1P1A6_UNCNE|nr:putative eka-like protein [Erysiphe necator]